MKILRTRAALIEWRSGARGTVGFVPTMGALHEGHLSLVKEAGKKCDLVIASIFVNPTQFGPKEDFKSYPHREKEDLELLRQVKCDAVFIPKSPKEVYRSDDETSIAARKSLSSILCGKFRPGHFDGVCTVVYKLFAWVKPHSAFFGEKDFQQLQIITAMAEDLSLSVKVIGCRTLREKSGLAMSSRNLYLSPAQRREAAEFYRAMKVSKTIPEAKKRLRQKGFEVQYLEKYAGRWVAAVFFNKVRLIDNLKK